ncbi:hypothetical protein [Verrucomicrobium sp. BvORR106]|uniref:hypothetical protein n=1 Tax=Verrucomicrobium sp. BvORR106 TaxID=1403819 RepID=UPI000570F506|nr:hypothetical protein [Verrucomicrobium sp. BvORR106]
MGEIGLILGELFMLIIEATWWASVLFYYGLISIFSARHREKLKQHWRRSTVSKITLVLYTGVGLVWVSAVGWYWIHILTPQPEPESDGNTLTLVNKAVTPEDRKALLNTDKVEDLAMEGARVAIDKFKSTWKFRSSNQEAKEDAKVSKEAAAQQGSE